MRRTLNDAARAEGGEGGPLSKIRAVSRSGTRSLDVFSRTTTPVWTTVIRERTFLEMAKRSAATQFVWHDCDTNRELTASTLG